MVNTLKAALLGVTMLSGAALAAHAQTAPAVVTRADAARPVSFEVVLPLRNTDRLEALLKDQQNSASPSYHKWLSPADFGMRFGPDSAALASVVKSLQARGFEIKTHTRSLHVTGAAALAEQTFGTHLMVSRSASGHVHVTTDSALKLPAELAAANASVIAFTGHEAHPMSHVISGPFAKGDNRFGNNGADYFTDLKQAYSYPSVLATVTAHDGTTEPVDGTGVTLGVLMEGDVLDSDIKLIFDHEMYSTVSGMPDPTLFARVLVNGGVAYPGGAAFEAALDVQQELTGAPGSHVILYNIPDLSDDNITAGYTQIVDDNTVDLVSSSFGGCEANYFPKRNGGMDFRYILKTYHELFQQGNAQGITFLASSGDEAGKICPNLSYYSEEPAHFGAGASSPASDPNVTGVGGTNLVTVYDPPSLNSAYAGENAWSDPEVPYDPYGFGVNVSGGVWGAGGGASGMFNAPDYQALVTTTSTKRITPDIGMQVGGCPGGLAKLNPKTGYCDGGDSPINGNGNTNRSAAVVALGGARYGVIGTSVSSPELASAIALLIEQKGRMGNLNTYIYTLAAAQAAGGTRVFHTGIPGYNGLEQVNLSSTYSIAAGVGTPIVNAFVGLPGVALAGFPQTPSNP